MYDFFISYNKSQKSWVRRLAAELARTGSTYFFDEEDIAYGEDIVGAIARGLSNSNQVLLIMSKESVGSRWVELEWATSLHGDPGASNRRLIPVLLDDCEVPFLLRRLKLLDARSLDVADVVKLLRTPRCAESADNRQNEKLAVDGRPVCFGSKQYVLRGSDRELNTALGRYRPAALFGPRKVGKTSMMHRAFSESLLRGCHAAFIDLQGLRRNCDAFFSDIAHWIADDCGVAFRPSNKNVGLDLQKLIRVVCSEKSFVLFLDEIDVLEQVDDLGRATGILRSVLGHPSTKGRFSVVCAGYRPLYRWTESSPYTSPWWNLFEFVRVSPFSIGEIQQYLHQFEIVALSKEIDLVWRLTGGSPYLVARLAVAMKNGDFEDAVQSRELRTLAETPLSSGQYSLKENFSDCLRRIATCQTIDSDEIREGLWLAGITRDPNENPPKPASDILATRIHKLSGSQ